MKTLPFLGLLSVSQLAQALGVQPKTIHNRISKAPGSLPPMVEPPGSNAVYFRHESVQAWLDAHTHTYETVKRGRPTKRQQLLRKQALVPSQQFEVANHG